MDREFSTLTKKPLTMPDQEQEMKLSELQHAVRTHHSHGNYPEALSSAKTVLAVSMEHFGRNHPSTASAFNNLGLMHKLQGDYVNAREMYHEALQVYGDMLGKDHASYAAALHNIAVLNTSQCHLDESLKQMERLSLNEQALEYSEEAWRIRTLELGKTHPFTLASQSHMGSTLADMVMQQASTTDGKIKLTKLTQQRWQQAEEHLRKAMNAAIQTPRGEVMKDTKQRIITLYSAACAQSLAVFLKTKATLDEVYNDEESLAEAKGLYEEVLIVRSHLLDPLHPDTVATKFSLAELLQVLGQDEEANKIRADLVEDFGVQELDETNVEGDNQK